MLPGAKSWISGSISLPPFFESTRPQALTSPSYLKRMKWFHSKKSISMSTLKTCIYPWARRGLHKEGKQDFDIHFRICVFL
jgi:hypothetical protein